MSATRCPTCGGPVRVEGRTTQFYVPDGVVLSARAATIAWGLAAGALTLKNCMPEGTTLADLQELCDSLRAQLEPQA